MYFFNKLGRLFSTSALALAGLLVAGSASADDSANIAVGVTVTVGCTIDSTALAFPGYDAVVNASLAVGANATLTVQCTNGFETFVSLDEGENAGDGSSTTAPVRQMTDGTNFLSYVLNQDSQGGSVAWGSTGLSRAAITGTGEAESMTVYGQMPAGQNPVAGVYGDVVIATVLF